MPIDATVVPLMIRLSVFTKTLVTVPPTTAGWLAAHPFDPTKTHSPAAIPACVLPTDLYQIVACSAAATKVLVPRTV